jgi:hypothetical protein
MDFLTSIAKTLSASRRIAKPTTDTTFTPINEPKHPEPAAPQKHKSTDAMDHSDVQPNLSHLVSDSVGSKRAKRKVIAPDEAIPAIQPPGNDVTSDAKSVGKTQSKQDLPQIKSVIKFKQPASRASGSGKASGSGEGDRSRQQDAHRKTDLSQVGTHDFNPTCSRTHVTAIQRTSAPQPATSVNHCRNFEPDGDGSQGTAQERGESVARK